jgi:hypothetical protein
LKKGILNNFNERWTFGQLISENRRQPMGGYGSGRSGGQSTVESAFRIDIDVLRRRLRRHGMIPLGPRAGCVMPRAGCVMQFSGCDVECEAHFDEPWNSWVRLKYRMTDYWTGEPLEIDDKIRLTTSRPPFGGLRWWFVCPCLNRKVRKLYLPPGGRHFWSRRAYRLAYGSQRETATDRAYRGRAKIKARLIGSLDPDDWDLPPKPKWMRWRTYNRYVERYDAYEDVLNSGIVDFAAKFMGRF